MSTRTNTAALLLTAFLAATAAAPASAADLESLVEGNNGFAVDLYKRLKPNPGNLFFSPYSVSSALAMVYAGARGATEKEAAEVLHFDLGQNRTHAAMADLAKRMDPPALEGRWPGDPQEGRKPFELVVANALWGQKGYTFKKTFLDLLADRYEAGLTPLDFRTDAEKARVTINDWVAKKTKQRILDLILPGQVSATTRLVLTNAIYFKSAWSTPFQKSITRPAPFHLGGGGTADVPLMRNGDRYRYAEKDAFRAVALPYVGDALSMVVLLPRETDGLGAVEEWLSAGRLGSLLGEMKHRQVLVGLPKFETTCRFELGDTLKEMGMTKAFSSEADFSGMADTGEIFIGAVVHKAFVKIDEAGTEAAAATAVVMEGGGPPGKAVEFIADRPFLFLIRDDRTGSILFMGRLENPSGD